jgi:hypothetical protein
VHELMQRLIHPATLLHQPKPKPFDSTHRPRPQVLHDAIAAPTWNLVVQATARRKVASAVHLARAWEVSRPATSNEPSGLTIAQRHSSSCSRSVRAKFVELGRHVTSSVAKEKRQLAETKAASAAEGMVRKEHHVE